MRNLIRAVTTTCMLVSMAVFAAVPVNQVAPEILNIDMQKLTGEFTRPEEIARARVVNISPVNSWVKGADGASTWDYALTVPGATSLALRFVNASIPVGTLLTVAPDTGNGHVYSSQDLPRSGTFTTVFVPGDVLRLHVRAVQPEAAVLNADRVYVGAVNPVSAVSEESTPDVHAKAVFKAMQSSGTLPSACNGGYNTTCRLALLQNYACNASMSNINQSRASVGLLISGDQSAESCSGTLVNNLTNNGKGYIVTAGHCAIEGEGPSTGVVNFNQSVNVYWSAIDGACGTPYYTADGTGEYKTVYTSLNVPVSTEYATVTHLDKVPNPHPTSVECSESGYNGTRTTPCTVGADMWLLGSTKAPPSGANPFWAGVNASDPTAGDTAVAFVPGAPGQPTAPHEPVVTSMGSVSDISFPFEYPQVWAFSTTGAYNGEDTTSSYPASNPGAAGPSSWIVDFDQGNNDGSTGQVLNGSSGSGLFDSAGMYRGIASYIHEQDFDTAYFRVDLAWNGNATDSTSQLKTYLDPQTTGATSVPGFEDTTRSDNLSLVFGALENTGVAAGGSVDLRYFANETVSCTTSSQPSVSGWNGPLAYTNGTPGTATVTVQGATTLTITCTNAAGFQKSASVAIDGGFVADTTPDAFTFSTVGNAAPNSTVSSNVVTISGVNTATPISVAGATYSVNGGAFTSGAGSIQNGQTLQLAVATQEDGTTSVGQVTVGGYSTTFTVSTMPAATTTGGTGGGTSGGGTTGSTTGGVVGTTTGGSSGGGGGGAPGIVLMAGVLLSGLGAGIQKRRRKK